MSPVVKQYTPLALANFFIEEFGSQEGIEHMKLQKLVYCSHGWWLVDKEAPIVNEKPQVWRYGPVFESMYHTLKPYGRNPIQEIKSSSPFSEPDFIEKTDEKAIKLLGWIWDRYGHLSSLVLSDMTHKKGTPWYNIAKKYNFNPPQGEEIGDEVIRKEFFTISTRDFLEPISI